MKQQSELNNDQSDICRAKDLFFFGGCCCNYPTLKEINTLRWISERERGRWEIWQPLLEIFHVTESPLFGTSFLFPSILLRAFLLTSLPPPQPTCSLFSPLLYWANILWILPYVLHLFPHAALNFLVSVPWPQLWSIKSGCCIISTIFEGKRRALSIMLLLSINEA